MSRSELWERIERVLDAYDAAGAPGPDTFTLHVHYGGFRDSPLGDPV
ncbi:hypothetical protein [Streptomyces sp. NPDC014685]